MTVTDRTDASEQEFRDRIAPFDTAPTPPEVREAAVVEEVHFHLLGHLIGRHVTLYGGRSGLLDNVTATALTGELAAAAVAAYRAQDGGAEEAVRRVEAVVSAWEQQIAEPREMADWQVASKASHRRMIGVVRDLRAALAPQADR